jgi:hypothetical protein
MEYDGERGLVKKIVDVEGRKRALVLFDLNSSVYRYEQYNDLGHLVVLERRKDRTMSIDITINDLTGEQAEAIVKAAQGILKGSGNHIVEDPRRVAKSNGVTAHAAPAEDDEDEVEDAPPPKKGPTVDPKKIAAMAAANPAKQKVESKPSKKNAAAQVEEEEEYEENDHGVQQPKGHMAKVHAKHGKPDPTPAEEEEEDEEPAPKKASAKANGKAKAAPPPEEDEEDVADELLNARKLRDVLGYLMDNGVNDPDDIKAECNRLKDKVPVLQRINDLDSRIDRTLEVMDMGDATS